MQVDFLYTADLYSFAQIIVLGSILSIVVMYIVELLKSIILTSHTNLFSLLCFVISFVFGIAWSYTFSQKLDMVLSLWLGLFLWLGSNGFYQWLESSDSWLGKTVKSYSSYLNEVHLKNEYGHMKDLESENKTLKNENEALKKRLDNYKKKYGEAESSDTDSDAEQPEDNEPQPEIEPDIMLSTNFAKSEFRCQCGGKFCDGYPAEINRNLLEVLELVRARFGKPITITSGLRCEEHNKAVGGVTTSKHMLGRAADFSFKNMNKKQVIAYLSGLKHYEFAYSNETSMKYAVHIQVKED